MANKQRDPAKESFWREMLRRQAASGLSARAFCQREKLAESGFYAWRRTIAQRDAEHGGKDATPTFVPVVVTDQSVADASITIELADGRLLRLPESIAAERLAELVHALEAKPPTAGAVR